MGLDSVELIIAFEKYFKVDIPDREAEKMYGISDVVDYLASIKDLKSEDEEISVLLQHKFASLLKLQLVDPIFRQYNNKDEEFWKLLKMNTGLKIVVPKSLTERQIEALNFFQKLFYKKPDYITDQINYKRFLEVIAYINYETLVNPAQCNTREAVTVAVAGITIKLNGLDPYEVYPDSRFVDDLGIN